METDGEFLTLTLDSIYSIYIRDNSLFVEVISLCGETTDPVPLKVSFCVVEDNRLISTINDTECVGTQTQDDACAICLLKKSKS